MTSRLRVVGSYSSLDVRGGDARGDGWYDLDRHEADVRWSVLLFPSTNSALRIGASMTVRVPRGEAHTIALPQVEMLAAEWFHHLVTRIAG